MEIPLGEIEALCAYVEINLEMGVEFNSQVWRQCTQKVRAYLDASLQKRAPAKDKCKTCDGAEMIRKMGEWVDCPACHPPNSLAVYNVVEVDDPSNPPIG